MCQLRTIAALSFFFVAIASQAKNISGHVIDNATNSPIEGATVCVVYDKKTATITNSEGVFVIDAPNAGENKLEIAAFGYKTLLVPYKPNSTYRLSLEEELLEEVVVTAVENNGLTSTSKIGDNAMRHLQPSSFSDVLELLPGGMAQTPTLEAPNTIALREAGISSAQYCTSSLGTSFIVDGAPISSNANLQRVNGAWDSQTTGRDYTNAGVDMRTISTDDIESIDIVRGIPSAEYGELTSGLVEIVRKKGTKDLAARFKADMNSKLFYMGKGFEWEPQKMTLNISADYLDSKSDPRNLLENYKRITGSVRTTKEWKRSNHKLSSAFNLDYGGSFDNEKIDPDLNLGGVDSYSSKYNRYAGAWNLQLENNNKNRFFRRAEVAINSSCEFNETNRTRLVHISSETPCTVTRVEGESFTPLVYPYTYVASHIVDGKPVSAFAKLNGDFHFPFLPIDNNLKTGGDWHYDKNNGDGQLYNPLLPLYTGISSRYRPYYDIPSEQTLAFFAEEKVMANIGKNKVDAELGIRSASMLNLGTDYKMNGKWYADPRLNAGWTFPAFSVRGKEVTVMLSGGYGWHTKFPTIDQLYPEDVYIDLVEMNYWHENRNCRGIYTQTYIEDATNYELEPARNQKKEVRLSISCNGNRLSVTCFEEDMKSGFRSVVSYSDYPYKRYDVSGIDANQQTTVPNPTDLPYEVIHELSGFSKTYNGSRTLKRGVEYTLSSRRIPRINSRLTVNGAYFKTVYENSVEIQEIPNSMVFGERLHYAGVYADDDGYIRESHNTNFTFDTDIPNIDLGVSLSAQCMWQTASQNAKKGNVPIAYIDRYGNRHEFTSKEVGNDQTLSFLIRTNNASLYERQTVPFAMNINLKATKKLFEDKMMVALFVNKLIDAHPSYVRNGYEIRRYVKPYFGLEMNIKI